MSFSEEVSTSGAIAQGGAASIFIAFFSKAIQIMVPYLIVTFFIVLLDCYYGIRASKKREEEIRTARAIRRTVSKLFEYVCWIIIAASLSIAANWNPLQYIVMGIPVLVEMSSITQNYLFLKGKMIKGLNIIKIIGDKTNTDLSGVEIKDIEEKKEEPKQKPKKGTKKQPKVNYQDKK